MADVIEITNNIVSDFMNFSTFSEDGFNSGSSYVLTELELSSQRQNKMEGFAVLESPPNGFYKVFPDSDTYVTSENVYYSYSKASILHSGKLIDGTHMMFMSFYDLINENIPSEIVDNIISSRLVLKPTMPYTGIIRLYETDRVFDAEYMTWLNHPEAELLIAGQRYNNASTIKIELGKRIKDYIQRKKVHKGFYVEADSGRIEVYSMNMSNPNFVPYVEIEYMDTSLVRNTISIDTEFNMNPISYINTVFNLEPIYPSIKTELYLTKDSINNIFDFRNINSIDTTLSYKANSMSGIISELTFSKDVLLSNLLIGTQTGILTEFTFKARVSDNIDTSLSLLHVNPIPSTFNLIYQNVIDTTLQLNPVSIIDTSMSLRFENVVSNLDTSLEFRKENNITSELELKPISILNTSLELKYINKLDTSLDLVFENSIPTNISNLIWKNQESYISNKLFYCSESIMSKLITDMELTFKGTASVITNLIVKQYNGIDTAFDLKINATDIIDTDLTLSIIDSNSIITDFDLVTSNDIPTDMYLKFSNFLDSSLEFRKEDNIASELDLIFNSNISSELDLIFNSNISSELDLIFNSNISSELDLVFNSALDTLVPLKIANISNSIDTNLIYYKDGTSSLISTLVLIKNDLSTIPADIDLIFNNRISTNLDLVFSNGIDSQLNLVFSNNIPSDLSLRHYNKIDTDLDLVFKSDISNQLDIIFNNKIDTDLDLVFINQISSIETSLVYIADKESYIESNFELILKLVNKAKIMIAEAFGKNTRTK